MTDFSELPFVREALASAQTDSSSESHPQAGATAPSYHTFDTLGRIGRLEPDRTSATPLRTAGSQAPVAPISTPSWQPFGELSDGAHRSAPAGETSAHAVREHPPRQANAVQEDVTAVWRRRPLSELFAFLRGDTPDSATPERSLRDIFG